MVLVLDGHAHADMNCTKTDVVKTAKYIRLKLARRVYIYSFAVKTWKAQTSKTEEQLGGTSSES